MTEISRQKPLYVIFLIDQSTSMKEKWNSNDKATGVSVCVNSTIDELLARSVKGGDSYADYFYISAIGYGGKYYNGNEVLMDNDKLIAAGKSANNYSDTSLFVGNAFSSEALVGKKRFKISELAPESARKIEYIEEPVYNEKTGRIVRCETEISKWVEPFAIHGKHMDEAFNVAFKFIKDWYEHPVTYEDDSGSGTIDPYACNPPIIINVTDGMAQDDPKSIVSQILNYPAEKNEKVIIFNAYIGDGSQKIEYPSNESVILSIIDATYVQGPYTPSLQEVKAFGSLLFQMSSILPQSMVEVAKGLGIPLADSARGLLINPTQADLTKLFDIGTRPGDTANDVADKANN